MELDTVICGDVLDRLPEIPNGSVNCCVTSPPYWGLRDYGVEGQLGLEKTPEEYVAKMVAVFREVWRVLRDDGTLWLNMGDSYMGCYPGIRDAERWPKQSTNDHRPEFTKQGGLPAKNLCGIPWRVAFALQADGWYLRQDIIWHKPNPMPESVTDRCTKAHEYIFLMTKKPRYYYDAEAIREDGPTYTRKAGGYEGRKPEDGGPGHAIDVTTTGRNKRSVWTVPTAPYSEAHFATFPPKLIEPCILAGCPEWVCKKCGEPRRRIVEKGELVPTSSNYDKHAYPSPHEDSMDQGVARSQTHRSKMAYENKTTGWTDCGCKHYFCNNCKKFLTPELINGIINAKGDDYAIQGHREKEEVLKGVGKEAVSGTERTGGVVEADSLLCEKVVPDLWLKIFREKDATDLFSEMRGSVADTEREPQQFSERTATAELQGGLSQQERIQSNPDTGEVCNGTPLLDGATSGAETDPQRGSSPQKRDKGRQQADQSCDKSEKSPLRNSVVPALQKEFQAEIVCPCCLSSHITIEPAGFDGGVVLDPFGGAFTTALVAYQNNRHYTIIELSKEYIELGKARLKAERDKYALFND